MNYLWRVRTYFETGDETTYYTLASSHLTAVDNCNIQGSGDERVRSVVKLAPYGTKKIFLREEVKENGN